jgi:protein SCO1/2
MKSVSHWSRPALWLCGLLTAATSALAAQPPLPGDSVLQLPGVFVDQASRRFTLATRRGQPQLISMFYANCQSVCPLLIETSTAVVNTLEPAQRSRLRVLLVSLDPARDTPAVLAQVVRDHRLDTTRWTLARTEPAVVRRLAAVLDIRYRQLEGGEFNHTSVLILLDGQGRMLARTEQLGARPDPQFVVAIRGALRQGN